MKTINLLFSEKGFELFNIIYYNYTFLDKEHLVLDYSGGLLTEANFNRMISNPMFEDLFRQFSRYLECATLREKIEYLNNCLDEVANKSMVRRR